MARQKHKKKSSPIKEIAPDVNRLSLRKILLSTPAIALAIMTGSIIVRVSTAAPLDLGGDAYWIWRMCRELIEQGKPFAPPGIWDHRMMRWALSIPMIVIQKLFNASPASYYVWPTIYSSLTAVFIFLIGNKLISRTAGIFASIIMILHPEMLYRGSQITPTGTATLFILIAVYCLLRWKESSKWPWLIVAAAAVFCAYGAKITSVFFLPGIVISLLYYAYRGKYNWQILKPAAIFVTAFAILFVAECVVFQKITTTTEGRIGCLIQGRHGSLEKRIESLDRKGDFSWKGRANTLTEYLLYFAAYHKYIPQTNAFLMNFGFLLAAAILVFKNKRLYMPALIFIPAYLLFTYAVHGAYPFMRMERVNTRYYTTCYAIAILMITCAICSACRNIQWKKLGIRSGKGNYPAVYAAVTCLIFGVFIVDVPRVTSNITITRENGQQVKRARSEGYPILMKATDTPQRDWKYIKRYRAFYGPVTQGFYNRPQAVKLPEKEGKESIYYVLEHNQARELNTYLLSSIQRRFVLRQLPVNN